MCITWCVIVYRERQERKAREEEDRKKKREKKDAEKKKRDEERKKADLEKEQAKEENVSHCKLLYWNVHLLMPFDLITVQLVIQSQCVSFCFPHCTVSKGTAEEGTFIGLLLDKTESGDCQTRKLVRHPLLSQSSHDPCTPATPTSVYHHSVWPTLASSGFQHLHGEQC